MIQVLINTVDLLGPADLMIAASLTLSWPLALIWVALERRGWQIWPVAWAGLPMGIAVGALSLVSERQQPALFDLSRAPARNLAALAAETHTRALSGEWFALFCTAMVMLGLALISAFGSRRSTPQDSPLLPTGAMVAVVTAMTAPGLLGDVYGWMPVLIMGTAMLIHVSMRRGASDRVVVRTAMLGATACLLMLAAAVIRSEAAVFQSVAMLDPVRDLVRVVDADALRHELQRKSWVASLGVLLLIWRAFAWRGVAHLQRVMPSWTPVVLCVLPLGWFHLQGAATSEQVLAWGAAPELVRYTQVPEHNLPLDSELRTVGGCLVTGPPFEAGNFGHTAEGNDVRPCASVGLITTPWPHTARPVVAVSAELSSVDLVRGVPFLGYGELILLTQLPIADWPASLAPWKMARVAFTVLPSPVEDDASNWVWPDSRERPMAGSLLWTGTELWSPAGPVAAADVSSMTKALTPILPKARFDLIVLPSDDLDAQDLVDACLAVRTVKIFGTRCVLAAGKSAPWRAWAVARASKSP